MAKLCVVPFFAEKGENNRKGDGDIGKGSTGVKVGEVREGLRCCLDVQVRNFSA